eukprot:4601776-Pleurochrysis_carterae.AAC.1
MRASGRRDGERAWPLEYTQVRTAKVGYTIILVCVTPDGKHVVTASKKALVWRLDDGELVNTLKGATSSAVFACAHRCRRRRPTPTAASLRHVEMSMSTSLLAYAFFHRCAGASVAACVAMSAYERWTLPPGLPTSAVGERASERASARARA